MPAPTLSGMGPCLLGLFLGVNNCPHQLCRVRFHVFRGSSWTSTDARIKSVGHGVHLVFGFFLDVNRCPRQLLSGAGPVPCWPSTDARTNSLGYGSMFFRGFSWTSTDARINSVGHGVHLSFVFFLDANRCPRQLLSGAGPVPCWPSTDARTNSVGYGSMFFRGSP